MSKITKYILVFFLILSTNLFAALKELPKNEISKIEQLELFKKNEIKIKKAFDAGSLYILNIQIKENSDEIFLTKDKKYIISGNIVDVNTGSTLSAPVDISILKNKEALTFGTGKDEYVLFTDPECTYCKKFESYLPQIKDKVKIKVFLFPLDFHENAKDLSLYIMNQKTASQKIDAMFEFNIGDDLSKVKNAKYSKETLANLEKKLEEQMALASILNVQATPTLFDKEGNAIIWVELLEKYGIEVK